ncbi:hypothetical protein ACHQM5_008944 [Ranunculus cassubicifolius]
MGQERSLRRRPTAIRSVTKLYRKYNESFAFSYQAIATTNPLLASIKQKLNRVPEFLGDSCTSMVPRALRKVNEDAYTPQVVSIGPYHCRAERLQIMEQHKVRYLSDFFDRKPKNDLETFVKKLEADEEICLQFYGLSKQEDSKKFVEMMLFDGCFILELMFKHLEYKEEEGVMRDPLFGIHSMITALRVDMLLLENQFPLDILEQLFVLFTGEDDQVFNYTPFVDLILNFFNFQSLVNIANDLPRDKGEGTDEGHGIMHFLDLLRECCLPTFPIPPEDTPTEDYKDHNFIPSATELHEAGIKFKKVDGNCFLDLKFSSRRTGLTTWGIFEIPPLTVQDTTEVIFRNLIAFEQCYKPSGKQHLSHYMALLDFLINSPKDVALLRRTGIINNLLGDNEQVSALFNRIFVGVTVFAGNFSFDMLCKDVTVYYNTPWHSFQAMLDREYFYSPWSTASSIAVIIVVVCTIIQAVCSVISVIPGK